MVIFWTGEVAAVATMHTVLAAGADITVTLLRCDPVSVKGDRMRLRQLLLNLADNAVKYNHKGGTVTLSLTGDGGLALFRSATQEPCCRRSCTAGCSSVFFRGDAAHGSQVEGSGLGLSIAHSISESHGGSLGMDATAEGCTRLTLSLPIG